MIVTVVTPTLNARRYLRECIESVKQNESSGLQVEHVIVDGGSTDGTLELAESYGLRILKGKDKGIFDAINKGSFDSSGELLGFLGSDDVLLKGALDLIVRAYGESRKPWVVGGIRWIDENGRDLGGLRAAPAWMRPWMLVCLDWNPIMHVATYISRNFFSELAGFNVDYKDAGDFEMFARALSRHPYATVPAPIACYRRTGENNSAVNRERTRREVTSIRAAFGPSSGLERAFWRGLLKIWFNFGNPDWLGRKISNAMALWLGLREKTYF